MSQIKKAPGKRAPRLPFPCCPAREVKHAIRAPRACLTVGTALRTRFMLALLLCSLACVALVGGVACRRLMHKFDRLVLEDASRNFRADVAA